MISDQMSHRCIDKDDPCTGVHIHLLLSVVSAGISKSLKSVSVYLTSVDAGAVSVNQGWHTLSVQRRGRGRQRT